MSPIVYQPSLSMICFKQKWFNHTNIATFTYITFTRITLKPVICRVAIGGNVCLIAMLNLGHRKYFISLHAKRSIKACTKQEIMMKASCSTYTHTHTLAGIQCLSILIKLKHCVLFDIELDIVPWNASNYTIEYGTSQDHVYIKGEYRSNM